MLALLGFISTVLTVVVVILAITYFVNRSSKDYEKHSSYECGFEPFGDARSFFDIHFYTIGLLFIIFDLEIVFLVPFVVNIEFTTGFAYISFYAFMVILLTGFYYEWALGLLN
jgi:NADH-quinone oxidoreductase subunit A